MMSDWSTPTREPETKVCINCTGSGQVVRHENARCDCIVRCSIFCARTRLQPVTRTCSHCNGSGRVKA